MEVCRSFHRRHNMDLDCKTFFRKENEINSENVQSFPIGRCADYMEPSRLESLFIRWSGVALLSVLRHIVNANGVCQSMKERDGFAKVPKGEARQGAEERKGARICPRGNRETSPAPRRNLLSVNTIFLYTYGDDPTRSRKGWMWSAFQHLGRAPIDRWVLLYPPFSLLRACVRLSV